VDGWINRIPKNKQEADAAELELYNKVNPTEPLPEGWVPSDTIVAGRFAMEGESNKKQKEIEDQRKVLDEQEKENEKLKKLAATDPLTGLVNRRAFNEHMVVLMQRFHRRPAVSERKRSGDPKEDQASIEKRKPRHVSIIYFDLDRFKKINDDYGHDAGDMVLKAVGELFTDKKNKVIHRSGDFAARYGGEEFVVVVQSGIVDGVAMAEKIREEIKSLNLTYKDQPLQVHASFGVASTETADSLEKILTQADEALSKAKQSGRDKVVYCEERGEWPSGNESNIV
jgi:diguanylate cyclase (GGDEF)-like protein